MDVDLPICVTCRVQYPAPREDCPICLDERQYVGWDGQRWTGLGELAAAGHRGWIKEEGPGVLGVGARETRPSSFSLSTHRQPMTQEPGTRRGAPGLSALSV
jgi:hypothetical protein